MGWNLPDDWGNYYSNCSLCGSRYHASEGGCCCTEDKLLCVGTACNDSNDLDSYHEETVTVSGKEFCEHCLKCDCCDEDDREPLVYEDDADLLLCPRCLPEDHWCPAKGPLLDHLAVVTKPDDSASSPARS